MVRPETFTGRALALVTLASLACLALLAGRVALGRDEALGWLAANLLLAWIPLAAALAAARLPDAGARATLRLPLLALWLLFLPNAPYLITDLIHIGDHGPTALPLDIPVLGAFALTGLLIFLVSLHVVHRHVLDGAAPRPAWAAIVACVWLSSAGMYLGRVLRWNSWDLVGDPLGRLVELGAHLGDPSDLALAAVFTGGFAVCLSAAYSRFNEMAASRRRTRSG